MSAATEAKPRQAAQAKSLPAFDVHDMAAKLFVKFATPGSGYGPEKAVGEAYAFAEAFQQEFESRQSN